jgi:hypothetical protein
VTPCPKPGDDVVESGGVEAADLEVDVLADLSPRQPMKSSENERVANVVPGAEGKFGETSRTVSRMSLTIWPMSAAATLKRNPDGQST